MKYLAVDLHHFWFVANKGEKKKKKKKKKEMIKTAWSKYLEEG